MYEKGDLIKDFKGDLATVTREGYTYRFMEAQDYEMEDAGMGHMAGVYGTAYDVTYITGDRQGRVIRVRSGKGGWSKISPDDAPSDLGSDII